MSSIEATYVELAALHGEIARAMSALEPLMRRELAESVRARYAFQPTDPQLIPLAQPSPAGPVIDAEVPAPAAPPADVAPKTRLPRGEIEKRILRILQDGPELGLTCKEIAREVAGPQERNDKAAMDRYVSTVFSALARLVDEGAVRKDARLYTPATNGATA